MMTEHVPDSHPEPAGITRTDTDDRFNPDDIDQRFSVMVLNDRDRTDKAMLVCFHTGDRLLCGFRDRLDPKEMLKFALDTPVGDVWSVVTEAQRRETAEHQARERDHA